MHIDLSSFLTGRVKAIIDDRYTKAFLENKLKHIYFYELVADVVDDLSGTEHQAALQYIASHDCLKARMLFALSLCTVSQYCVSVGSLTASEYQFSICFKELKESPDKHSCIYDDHGFFKHCCECFILMANKTGFTNKDIVNHAKACFS